MSRPAHTLGGRFRGIGLPERNPPSLNHCVVTGELSAEPQEGRGPNGDPVTLLRIEFPVAEPGHHRALRVWAGIGIEVVDAFARERIRGLQGGASILVAGQISERWAIAADGQSSKCAVIVAAVVHTGPPPGHAELLIPGGRS